MFLSQVFGPAIKFRQQNFITIGVGQQVGSFNLSQTVNPAKTELTYLGFKSGGGYQYSAVLELGGSGLDVTATRFDSSGTGTPEIEFEVVEYY